MPLLAPEARSGISSGVFAELDMSQRPYVPRDLAELRRFGGRVAIRRGSGRVAHPPEYLAQRGLVLTNMNRPNRVRRINNAGDVVYDYVAYGREERKTNHIGTTMARPFRLRRDKTGRLHFSEYVEASSFQGEDLRLIGGVIVDGHLGTHHCWVATTVIAQPNNPIKQVVFLGDNLLSMHPIAEIPDTKNVMPIAPQPGNESPVTDMLARVNWTDITYFREKNIFNAVRTERVMDLDGHADLTGRFRPPGYHYGSNYARRISPDAFIADVHGAHRELLPPQVDYDGDSFALHYRGERFGYDIAEDELTALGVTMIRDDFYPLDVEPKVSEGGIHYGPVVYGAIDSDSIAVTGISDRWIGYGEVERLPDLAGPFRQESPQPPVWWSIPEVPWHQPNGTFTQLGELALVG